MLWRFSDLNRTIKTLYEAIADALHLATEEVLPKRARAEPLWFSQNVLALQGLINLRNNAFDAYHITRSSHAVLHCKVLAEHYNVLLEKPNPTGFLSSWVVSMTGSVEPRAPKLHGGGASDYSVIDTAPRGEGRGSICRRGRVI